MRKKLIDDEIQEESKNDEGVKEKEKTEEGNE